MITRSDDNKYDEEDEIRKSIEHKDISGLFAASNGGQISDQTIADMLNKNYNSASNDRGQVLESKDEAPRQTVAYAITVTKDGPFVDGALVLGINIP